MNERWPRVRLGEVLRQVERAEGTDSSRNYRLLGVRWYGQGLFVREEKLGADMAANRVYPVQPGDFVYNRLFAWKGSFAVAGTESIGAHVSNEFPCFVAEPERLDPCFLLWFFRRQTAWNEVLGLSVGVTPTSRNRLKESIFLAMEMPLPPLPEQRRMVARIEGLAAQIHEARALRSEAAEAFAALASFSLRSFVPAEAWKEAPLSDVCTQITDGEHATPERIPDGRVPLATAKNVRDGYLDLAVTDFVSDQTAERCWKRCRPSHDDVLMVCVGATTGRVCRLNYPPDIVIVRSVALLRPAPDKL